MADESVPLYIPGSRVKELVSMEDVMKVVETGLGAFSRQDGGVVQPVRSVVPVTEHSGWAGHWCFLLYVAYSLFDVVFLESCRPIVGNQTVLLLSLSRFTPKIPRKAFHHTKQSLQCSSRQQAHFWRYVV